MTTWTCPECSRTFGRVRAGHTCAPAMTLLTWLDTSPSYERPVALRLTAMVRSWPDVIIEPVQVGLFLKRRSTFAQLRTMTRWTALTIKLPGEVTVPEPSRRVQRMGSRWFHTYNLAGETDLTGEVMSLVHKAYEADV
ncbi:MAG: DUF5655 domain-containing protein [Ornithinimicrobium sp.]